MKYPHTGLYYFCEGLGRAISKEARKEKNDINFFVPPSKIGVFGNDMNYLVQKNYHKILSPIQAKNSVWHATHQQTDYWPEKKAKAIVLTIHDLNFLHDSKSAASKKKYLKQLQQKVDAADAIVTVSSFTANEVVNHLQVGTKKPIVIHNGTSFQETEIVERPVGIGSQPFIFSIGTIARKKNFHVLPNLLVGNDFQLVIAGVMRDEDYKEEIMAMAKRLNVLDRVLFTGPLTEEEKAWCYTNCALVAFPSLAEGFGLPVLEAFHYGKPVLLSTYGSLPEIGDKHAYYVNNFSQEEMQTILTKAFDTEEETKRIQERKEYAATFSWQKSAAAYIHIYKSFQ